tara:strand:+ start:936 stop:1109 length:174 start_codon:yes stop_codon:yes gene_type:complete
MSDYKNYILEIEGVLHQLLEEMTNNQALDEIERRRGKSARMEAEDILKEWEKEYAFS